MSPDEVPVAGSESLLRVINDGGKWDPDIHQPRAGAFMPSGGDDDGISLYRAKGEEHAANFLTADDLLKAQVNPSVRQFGGVVSVTASEVTSLTSALQGFESLTVDPAPDVLPGHVLVRQLNRVMSQDKGGGRQLARDLAARLAKLARVMIPATFKSAAS